MKQTSNPTFRLCLRLSHRGFIAYREEKKGLQILLSYSQAGPGRKAKQGQEEISRNHVQRLFSALYSTLEEAKCVVKVGQF